MKYLILIITAFVSFTISVAQTNFKWEKIDSVAKSKAQIYSDTKMFIAETWKSAKNVIQNDDKDAGAIFIEGTVQKIGGSGLRVATFWYSYTVKFYIKEQKYKINIENVQFKTSDKAGWTADVADEWPGGMKCALSKKPWTELMTSLKSDMQKIVDDYAKYIKTPTGSNNSW
jgi:hypothetical protein